MKHCASWSDHGLHTRGSLDRFERGGDQLDAVDRGADVPKPRGVSQDPFIGIEQKG